MSARSRTVRRQLARSGVVLLLAGSLSGCSLFSDDEDSVFDVAPGECFLAPDKVTAQISALEQVDCGDEHDQEAFAVLPWASNEETSEDTFPGDDRLTAFADGACAQAFRGYVGVDYLDSGLFYTYLLPSPRSWQEEDRSVTCFVIDSGRPMTGSVKGSKK